MRWFRLGRLMDFSISFLSSIAYAQARSALKSRM
jgi:hypothetical protein